MAASTSLAAYFPNPRLVVLPDTGHRSALEQPGEFGDALVGFLTD